MAADVAFPALEGGGGRDGGAVGAVGLPIGGPPGASFRRRPWSRGRSVPGPGREPLSISIGSPSAGGLGASPAGRPPPSTVAAAEPDGFKNFSRFNRDKATWIGVGDAVLWDVAQRLLRGCQGGPDQPNLGLGEVPRPTIRCWSCGCSSGEEAYYLRMIWQRRLAQVFPELELTVLGTDSCALKIEAARQGIYPQHSVESLPVDWQEEFFQVPTSGPVCTTRTPAALSERPGWLRQRGGVRQKSMPPPRARRAGEATAALLERPVAAVPGGSPGQDPEEGPEGNLWQLRAVGGLRSQVSFLQQDVSVELPDGFFDVILSRYAVCLYVDKERKEEVLASMVGRLRLGGYLIIGRKDNLPAGFCKRHGLSQLVYHATDEFCPYGPEAMLEGIFRKDGALNPTTPSVVGSPVLGATAAASPCGGSEDPRLAHASHQDFLKAKGKVPDWISEKERVWRELHMQRMTERSRNILAKAVHEGRREEDGTDLLDRMTRDFEARLERRRAREAQRESEQNLECPVPQVLPPGEALARVSGLLGRFQQDMAKREAEKERAARQQLEEQLNLQPLSARRRRGGRKAGPGGSRAAVRGRSEPAAASPRRMAHGRSARAPSLGRSAQRPKAPRQSQQA